MIIGININTGVDTSNQSVLHKIFYCDNLRPDTLTSAAAAAVFCAAPGPPRASFVLLVSKFDFDSEIGWFDEPIILRVPFSIRLLQLKVEFPDDLGNQFRHF